jgi:RNA polymerase sigma-70 factor (ECF subfamily)
MSNAPLMGSTNIGKHTDESLVILAQQGRQDAFEVLYDRLFPTVYKRVRYSIPEQDVEDVTQEIFIATLKSLKNYRGEAKFRTWLSTLVSRQIADYYRRRSPVEAEVEYSEENNDDDQPRQVVPGEATGQDRSPLEDQILLRQCLQKIPGHYREIILCRFIEGLSFSEIANIQKMSLEATKSQFRRAIAMLQKMLEEPGYER